MKQNEKNAWKSITVLAVVLTVLAIAMAGTASAKSLYVIADIGGSPTPIQAYDIQSAPSYLAYQAQYGVPRFAAGAVGLTIDTDSEMLFITYEGSNTIQLVNATTMTDEGNVTAPGASNLAGIVVDQDKQKVYTVDRGTNRLYVYSWNAGAKTLTLDGGTYKTLPGVSQAHGLALNEVNDLLYVGCMVSTNNIMVFSTDDWSSSVTSYTVSQPVQGIAVDVTNGIIYTGHAGWPAYGTLNLLCKLDIGTAIETTVDIRTLTTSVYNDSVVGLAVDPQTSLLYITTGNQGSEGRTYDDTDQIMVFDSALTLLHSTGDIGDPTGLCIPGKDISYNPLNLNKDDGLAAGACVSPGDTITYTMTYTNGNPNTVTGVTLNDTVPSEVTVTDTGGGTQSGNTVTWYIGTLTKGQSGSKTLTVTVNSGAIPGSTIDNAATINGIEPNTGPTTKHEYTDVCTNQPPVADAGQDQTVEQDSLGGASVELDGSGSSDPDNDPLTYSWTWAGGSATDVNPTVWLPLGTTTVTLVVNDGTVDSAPDTVDITVEDNTPPVITCPADVTVEQESAAGTVVDLTATATDICDADVEITSDAPAIFPLGPTTVTFTATDDSGNSASCTTTVTVVDTTLPVISVTVSPTILWPPNHKMIDIVATVTVSDICDATPTVVLTSITSDEPDDTKGKPYDSGDSTSGDGNTVSDIQGAETGTEDYEFQLRAERAGAGDGRVYTITYTVTDASENEASASATVVVPHDMG